MEHHHIASYRYAIKKVIFVGQDGILPIQWDAGRISAFGATSFQFAYSKYKTISLKSSAGTLSL